MHQARPAIDDEAIDEIATTVRCHRQSVLRRLAHLPVRGRVAGDIDRAIAARLTDRSRPKRGTAIEPATAPHGDERTTSAESFSTGAIRIRSWRGTSSAHWSTSSRFIFKRGRCSLARSACAEHA